MSKFLGYLAFCKRFLIQLKHIRNWKYVYLIFYGFTPEKGYLYDFKKYGIKSYLSDVHRYVRSYAINKNLGDLFNDKLCNFFLLKEYTDKAIPIIAYINNNLLYFIDDSYKNKESAVILKDKNGWGGAGVTKALFDGTQLNTVEQEPISLQSFSNYIVTPLITNHNYAKKIFPDTLNTIRVLSAIIDGKFIIIRAIHRFGNVATGCVDNFSQGGISCNINLETGIIDSSYSFVENKKCCLIQHPHSGEKMNGVKVPFWREIKHFLDELHSEMKYVRYIGWDVAVTPDSFSIVEANHVSDINLIQVHYPLLVEPNIKTFFKNEFK